MSTRYLSPSEVITIHWALVKIFASAKDPIKPPGIRDQGLIESACSRPQTSSRTTEKYKTVEAKGAALFHSLVMNHAFHNGNKRTALVSLLVFLKHNRRRLDVSDSDLFSFVISVANNDLRNKTARGTIDEVVRSITDWIQLHVANMDNEVKPMRTADFIEACEKAGARCTLKRGTWNILGIKPRSSLSISNSTKQMGRMTIKRYLQQLGIVSSVTGVSFDEFEEGLSPEQEMIRRFRNVLNQLAHA